MPLTILASDFSFLRATGLALSLLVSPAFAEDALVREMELEITIRDLSRTVYADARTKVGEAIKKTTLWRKWRAALKPVQPKSQACRNAIADRREYRESYRRHGGTAETPPGMEAYMVKIRAACKEHFVRSRSPEYKRLRKVADAFGEELFEVRKMFVERFYIREMERRLTELKVKITKEVQRRLQRAFKKHDA